MLRLIRSRLSALIPALALAVPLLATDAIAGDKKHKDKGAAVSVDAKFSRFLLNPWGKIDGILLDDGTVVRVFDKAVKDTSLKAGDALHIDAKAKTQANQKMYVHPLIKKNGVVVADATQKPDKGQKPNHDKSKLVDLTATSTVTALFVGHGGKVHGVILADGTAAYAKHHGDLSTYSLKKGDAVTVTGKGGSYALGKALVIETIKLPNGDVKKP